MENQNLTKQEKRELRQEEWATKERARERAAFWSRVGTWGALFLGIAAVLVGMVAVVNQTPSPDSNVVALLSRAIGVDDWFLGGKIAKAELVEYSDFQCPACAAYHPLVKEVVEKMGNQVKFVYRHFPLSQHTNAKPAAYAAEAAGLQGKFWEMHDMIFANQTKWAERGDGAEIFAGYAKTLGLNMEQYAADASSSKVADKVSQDFDSGISSGVNSTPSFFLNGKKINNPRSYDEFRNVIEAAIANNS